jgi:hypothetical protein
MVYGRLSKEDEGYLQNSSQARESSFVRVDEFGYFRMQDPIELRTICTAILALVLYSQDIVLGI